MHLPPRLLMTAFACLLCLAQAAAGDGPGTVTVTGELKRWHAVTLTMAGPWASETGTPNPFLDYRMQVTFRNGSMTYVVPGYFAADGAAGESSATAGTAWRAHLCPDLTGTWTWTVSFTRGTDVAVNGGGTAVAPYHGASGSFTIAASDKTGRDFRGKGRLAYVGARYLRHLGSGEWFVKAGADSPENLLGYSDFDGTYDHGGGTLKTWAPHVQDWSAGDPSWQGGKGKGLIGAINYLAGKGCNAFSFLTFNVGGDGKDVWPFIAHDNRLRYDCSKLDQWNIVFSHADRLGMHLHFKTQERENDDGSAGLDGGSLGRERRLYYRELIARFAHHLALNWNLGEENSQTTAQRQAMAQYFADNDPYRHPIVLHTWPGEQEAVYRPLLGAASQLTGVSIQTGQSSVHGEVLQWIAESAAAGRPWVVANDEQGGANTGIPEDSATGSVTTDSCRATVLWGCLMAGGAGIESYFGYETSQSDLTAESFRTRARWWDACRHALAFFTGHLPFAEMVNRNALVGNSGNANTTFCLAKPGEVYAIYTRAGGSPSLNLAGVTGTFTVRWYDPRNGGALQTGSVGSIAGGGTRSLGTAPSSTTADWAILVQRSGGAPGNQPPVANAGADQVVVDADGNGTQAVTLNGGASADADGSIASWVWREGAAQVASGAVPTLNLAVGVHTITLTVTDNLGLSATDSVVVTVQAPGAGLSLALNLIDATTDQAVAAHAPIAPGATIDLAALGGITFQAVPSAVVGSIGFAWSGAASGSRFENAAPYALAGDANGNYAAWAVDIGTYTVTATAYAGGSGGGGVLASVSRTFTLVRGGGTPVGGALAVNFQPASAPTVAAWLVDSGLVYGARGNGRTYGWNLDNSATTRDRNAASAPDQLHDTLIHAQKVAGLRWEAELPNGIYAVTVLCGDPSYTDQVNTLSVEGVAAIDPDGQDAFDEHQVQVTVADGRLTIQPGSGASNLKLCAIEIVPVPVAAQ